MPAGLIRGVAIANSEVQVKASKDPIFLFIKQDVQHRAHHHRGFEQ
jgi:hypothetical protein